jgi:hypothetical protein
MDTDALIEALARDTVPVPRQAAERRLATGIGAGALVTLLLVIGALGVRPDLSQAAVGPVFWGKASYSLSLALVGFVLLVQLARPDTPRIRWGLAVLAPVGICLGFVVAELLAAPSGERAGLVGNPPWYCVPLILTLAAPVFAGLVWAFRRLAPTRLRGAGAAAGLVSGGAASTIYGLYCQQVSPTAVFTRYTLAIALAAAAGAWLGPRLLRW